MKRLTTEGSPLAKKIGALIISLLIVGCALVMITSGEEIIALLESYGLDLSRLGFDSIEPGELRVTFIDVGQGDAILMQTSENTLLVDCGTNASEKELVAALRASRVRTVDCLVLTHPHEDHIGGADKVLEEFRVGRIIMPEVSADSDESSVPLERVLEAAEEKSVPIEQPELGASYILGALTFIPIAPAEGLVGNDASIVLRVEFGETELLLTGDAELASELEMLADFPALLDCDVLKLGHHGSSSSTSLPFLEAVSPEWIVISCGEGNSYGHPHREVLELLGEYGISDERILRTDKVGTVRLWSDGDEIFVK